jgi:hypothetical protein
MLERGVVQTVLGGQVKAGSLIFHRTNFLNMSLAETTFLSR